MRLTAQERLQALRKKQPDLQHLDRDEGLTYAAAPSSDSSARAGTRIDGQCRLVLLRRPSDCSDGVEAFPLIE
jgi:hypothetical protein